MATTRIWVSSFTSKQWLINKWERADSHTLATRKATTSKTQNYFTKWCVLRTRW
jgi:hypothetical protein